MTNQVLFRSSSMLNQEISKQFLRYLNGTVTSTFKVGTAGCGGRGG